MDLENPLDKNQIQRIDNSKNQSQNAACEQKTASKKANFCSNAVFSVYVETKGKSFSQQNHLIFRFTCCFGVAKLYLTTEIMKICEQFLSTSQQDSTNTLQIL